LAPGRGADGLGDGTVGALASGEGDDAGPGITLGADPSMRCPHTPQNRAPGASGELHDGQFIPRAIVPHPRPFRTHLAGFSA